MNSTRQFNKAVTAKLAQTQPGQLDNFEQAFRMPIGSCRGTCDCGREFWDDVNSYDWERGEIEALKNNVNATPLAWTVSYLQFQGKEYVIDCPCWRDTAQRAIHFFETHGSQIAEYFRLEKTRKEDIAANSPVVH